MSGGQGCDEGERNWSVLFKRIRPCIEKMMSMLEWHAEPEVRELGRKSLHGKKLR